MRTQLVLIASLITLAVYSWIVGSWSSASPPPCHCKPLATTSALSTAVIPSGSPLPTPNPSAMALPLVVTSDDEPVGSWDGKQITYAAPPPCITALLKPRRTITAYELVRLLPFIQGTCLREADWKALGRARRHLQRIKL